MSFQLTLALILITILCYSINEFVFKNKLSKSSSTKVYISTGLFLFYLVTSYVISYPDPIFWVGLITISALTFALNYKVIINEAKRQFSYSKKDFAMNVLFYSLVSATLLHLV
ncbi:MAG: hypothetical protein BM564_03880 [Bacteroidetes bacterium MedPE-SWsnd-G2]|nr:MAG: hypothetical protein BM564_03880 [Bacteroidetes bacterium MedPE-SWsnd-G2]